MSLGSDSGSSDWPSHLLFISCHTAVSLQEVLGHSWFKEYGRMGGCHQVLLEPCSSLRVGSMAC